MSRILVEGDPRLRQRSREVAFPDSELPRLLQVLSEELDGFRAANGFGRAISAPQVGVLRRVIWVHLGATPFAVVNPEVTWRSDEMFDVYDDCLSVPGKIVRVPRHRSLSLDYLDARGRPRRWERLPEDLSELLQHEIDHLDGVLMTDRAVDESSILSMNERARLIDAGRPQHRLALESIRESSQSIDPVFRGSPQYECEPLSERLGVSVTLKVETNNPIRSFKGRGADHLVQRMKARGDKRALVCASAGNFGQGMAYACRKEGRRLTVYASTTANPIKIERMKALGAEVVLAGADFDAAKIAARQAAEASRACFVEDGREVEVSEGAGSIAVELLKDDPVLDAVILPLGNGALLNGVGRWFRAASPATQVIGVCSAGADAMAKSWQAGRPLDGSSVETIADGIAVRVPVPEALQDMQGLANDVVLVDDTTIREAMRVVEEDAGLLVEPAGAAGVAALLQSRSRFAGQRVATVLCGSNRFPEPAGPGP